MEVQRHAGASNPGRDSNGRENEPEQKKPKQGPRKRVSQACDKCRTRKDKCDGRRPSCDTCTKNGRPCSYDTNVKKRGLPEGYVRGLEKLWGLAIGEAQGVEDSILRVLSSGDENERIVDIWNDERNAESLVDIWRKSRISRELERLLSMPEHGPESFKRKRLDSGSQAEKRIGIASSPPFAGHATPKEVSPTMWQDSRYEGRPQDALLDSPRPRFYDHAQFQEKQYESILSPANHQSSSSNAPILTPDMPELPSETWHLLDVYFSYTHSWLPIIEKHDLLRTSYQYSQNRNNISASSHASGDHAILWAAIAYAKFQHRAINNIPHAQGPVAEMVWTAERMYTHARSLIPNEEGVFELGHVQALLILALTNLGIGHMSRAWILVGQAVRVAIDLELDKTSEDLLAALKSKSRTRHVFLGCFALDTLIAARLGRRPHLRAEDVNAIGNVDVDGLEEWDPWTDCLSVCRTNSGSPRGPASILSTFNNFIQVLKILNEAICVLGGPNKAQLSTILLEKLHIWSQSQDSPLYFNSGAVRGGQATLVLPHHYGLHLLYFNTLAKSQLLSYNQGNKIVNLEPSTRSARQITELLKQHSNNFGPLVVPPTFEYFTKTAYDVVKEVNDSIASTHIILNDWKHDLDYCLEVMEPAWPVFENFKASPTFQSNMSAPRGRRESQVAFDLITGMNQIPETSQIYKSPNSYQTVSPQTMRPPTSQIATTSQSNTAQSPISHRTTSFGQQSAQSLLTNFQQSPQVIFNTPADQWPIHPQSQISRIPTNPQHPLSAGSEFELDPTFQEFATLDATEWYLPSSSYLPNI